MENTDDQLILASDSISSFPGDDKSSTLKTMQSDEVDGDRALIVTEHKPINASSENHISEETTAQDTLDIPNDDNCCEPCRYRKSDKLATKFCQECDERYCKECAVNHTVQKQTKQHRLTDFKQKPVTTTHISCEPCLSKKVDAAAFYRCEECDEVMCGDCKDFHLSQKRNKNHNIIKRTEGLDCEPCSATGVITAAVCYCIDCATPEAFCEVCAEQHTALKMSRNHKTSTDIRGLQNSLPTNIKENSTTSNDTTMTQSGEKNENQESIIPLCEPCEYQGNNVEATHYCIHCDERYCDICTGWHKSHPKSDRHEIVDLSTIEPAEKKCDPCAFLGDEKSAECFCAECDDYLCKDCQKYHKSQKQTRGHITNQICHFLACDSCILIGQQIPATAFCEECEEIELFCAPCSKRHTSTKQTRDHQISKDLFKYKIRMLKNNEKEKNSFPSEDTTAEYETRPGRPYTVDTVHSNSLLLQWDDVQLDENDAYQVMFKDVNGKWKVYRNTALKPKIDIDGLQPNSTYIFRVRVFNDEKGTECPFSKESDPIRTGESPASAMMKMSPLVYNNPMPIHALPLTEDLRARNEKAKTRKLYLGTNDRNPFAKNVMIVGATGSGKSTLVNAMANFIMGVTWEDPFRFTLVDVEIDERQMEGDQACSQTQWITCYTIYQTVSNRLPFTINLIDTPGFGDTRGIEHDQHIVKQIKDLFCSKGDQGVSTIDGICFILKAPDARLTPTQSYIFESILSLFGNDIKDNICTLVTFADGQKPPVLASLEALDHKTLPYERYFTFNNSALFVDNTHGAGVQAPFFWEMGMCSCKAFFDHLETLPSKSLLLTAEVLGQREKLENTVEHLYQEVNNGLSKISVLEQEIDIFTKYRRQIRENKNFTYEVTEDVQEIVELTGRRQYTTNCLTCNFTCHENCALANDDEKAGCVAMRNGSCTECPGNCHWTQHKNTPYIIRLVPKKVKKKYSEKQKIYQEASKKSLTQEQILTEMCLDIQDLEWAISDRMDHIADCNNRLKEIALRPDPMTTAQYLDLMIDGEKREKKHGFQNRIDVLEKCKEKAQYGKTVQVFRDRLQGTRKNLHDTMNQPGEETSSSGKILEGVKNFGKRIISAIRI